MHRVSPLLKVVGSTGVTVLLLIHLVPKAVAMPVPGPAAEHALLKGSIVEPARCIRYCVRKEFCTVVRGRITCRPCSFSGRACHCAEWATACTGGHY
jgi:hypothetical protein